MTPTQLAERKKGIGGSDVASLWSLGYGCRRRLFYDKTNVPPDFEREATPAMELGVFLESWFAERYAIAAHRLLTKAGASSIHPKFPELRVNIDRIIIDELEPDREVGILEIKSVGRAVFYKIKREGLPEDYILQLQHGMLVTGASWGSFAIGSRDSGEFLWWDVNASPEVHASILAEGPKFWAQVENGPIPDALEPDDRRCQQCQWRTTCQGNALVQLERNEDMPQAPELAGLVAEKIERDALYDQALDLCNETDEELKCKLGDRQAVYVGADKVYFRPQAGRTLYKGKELLEAYHSARKALVGALRLDGEQESVWPVPDSFLDTSKPSRPLRVYGGKK